MRTFAGSFVWLCCVLCCGVSVTACAMDVVKLSRPRLSNDVQIKYKTEVLHRALQLTEDEYGAYQIFRTTPSMTRSRALAALASGQHLNVYISPPLRNWQGKAQLIPVPIRRGILNYRLLFVHRKDLPLFAAVTDIDQLKQLRVGSGRGHTTASLLVNAGFNVVTSESYAGLFEMLKNRRFDFLPRGVNEIYTEMDDMRSGVEDIVIEPTLALHIQMPTLVHVSIAEPRLAERLHKGLLMALESGELKAIFEHYYRAFIDRADLTRRRILPIDNTEYDDFPYPSHPDTWFMPEPATVSARD